MRVLHLWHELNGFPGLHAKYTWEQKPIVARCKWAFWFQENWTLRLNEIGRCCWSSECAFYSLFFANSQFTHVIQVNKLYKVALEVNTWRVSCHGFRLNTFLQTLQWWWSPVSSIETMFGFRKCLNSSEPECNKS